MYIAPQFFYTASEIILLGILLLPITRAFLSLVGKPYKIFAIVGYISLAILAVLALTLDGIWAHIYGLGGSFTEDDMKLQTDSFKVMATYHTLILATVIYIIIHFSLRLSQMRSHVVSSQVSARTSERNLLIGTTC